MFDYEGSRAEFLRLLAEQGEEPAFLKRSRSVDEAIEALFHRCREKRNSMLYGSRLKLGELAAIVQHDWSQLAKFLEDGKRVQVYADLYAELSDASPTPEWAHAGAWALSKRKPLRAFHQSVEKFNLAWTDFVRAFDFRAINGLIADYNEHYPVEKACAFGRDDISHLGFQPRHELTAEDLDKQFLKIQLPTLR